MIWERHRKAAAWGLALAGGGVVLLWPVEDRAGAPFRLRLGTRAELRTEVSGFIHELYLDEGATVPAGRPVARLNIPDLGSRVAQKRAELREVEARLYLLKEGTRTEVLAAQGARVKRAREWRDRARQDLERAQHSLQADLARLDKLIDQYEAELDYAHSVHVRNNRLYGTRVVAEEQYQETGKKRRVSLATLDQARAQKRARLAQGTLEAETELARREKALADAEETLDLLRLGPRAQEVDAESARRERVQEELRYLEGQQRKLLLTSPVAGTVTTPRLKEKVGQYVKEGDLICVVEVPEAVEAEVALSEQDVARVREGQAVKLRVRALPFETFHSRVDRVAPSALRPDESAAGQQPLALVPGTVPANINAYCGLNDPARRLRSGMTGYARITCDRRPIGAILADRVLRFLRTEFW
jgi:multidrug resistance efflux pump